MGSYRKGTLAKEALTTAGVRVMHVLLVVSVEKKARNTLTTRTRSSPFSFSMVANGSAKQLSRIRYTLAKIK